MLTMMHANPIRVEDGILQVDRKFYIGMKKYLETIAEPIVSIHPQAGAGNGTMDLVEVPLEELGYSVVTLKADESNRLPPERQAFLHAQISKSRLVYGSGFGATEMAHRAGVPYILVLEYDLQTQVIVTATQVSSPLRRAVRAARCVLGYARGISELRRAHGIHCNGYPVFDQVSRFNSNRLLYLDSRMSSDMLIPVARLHARLAARPGRRLRLLYSGRYEAMKGALDAVRVGLECLRRGLDIELHCYGQGSQKPEMERLAAQAPDPSRIQVHSAVTFPELVSLSQGFDVFVCCHIQSDPSCTYLESFGAGLPIVGYGNRMWQRLSEESKVGYASPVGRPADVATSIQRLADDSGLLAAMSTKALAFAAEHTFESEFKRRTDSLNTALLSRP